MIEIWACFDIMNLRSHWDEYSMRFNNAKICFRGQGNIYYWLDGEPITEEEFWL